MTEGGDSVSDPNDKPNGGETQSEPEPEPAPEPDDQKEGHGDSGTEGEPSE